MLRCLIPVTGNLPRGQRVMDTPDLQATESNTGQRSPMVIGDCECIDDSYLRLARRHAKTRKVLSWSSWAIDLLLL